MTVSHHYDAVIIGSGAAGLTLALHLAPHAKVAVLSKGDLTSGSTWQAQGGIAAVLDITDSTENHTQDTLSAGSFLSNEQAVRYTVEHGRESIEWLIDQGVPFTKSESDFHLTKEGGHSHRRIIHAADATGKAMHQTLIQKAKESDNIDVFEGYTAVDLVTRNKLKLPKNRCIGVYALNNATDHVEVFNSPNTILATGGASKAYLYTSNPDGATGDGIAMAWRAGCRVANLEFNQFHPTCLYHPKAKSFLITEAVRGEGGHLLLPNGERFMTRFDPRGELAPRDIVARAIDHEMKRLGCTHLLLDISHKPADFVKEHFPTIYKRCLELGIDITQEPIPIVPAAHYTCGGVMADKHGQTDVAGLYAIGETAFTGLHGANRLASNSLLECLVYGRSAAQRIIEQLDIPIDAPSIPAWDESQVTDSDEDVVISHNWDELRRFMWDYVGIVRTNKRLQRAKHRVDMLQKEITEFYSNYKVSKNLIEMRNLAVVSDLIIRSAMLRQESRGLHFSLNYPQQNAEALDTVLTPVNYQWK
ncbi:MAG: L-aspartate oxidase [Pontibacterium sp.]